MWECSSRSVQPRSKQNWHLTAWMRQAVKSGKKPRRCQAERRLRLHQPILMTMRSERGANNHGRRNEVFAHHSLGNLSGTKVARILVARNHIQIDDCSHCAQG